MDGAERELTHTPPQEPEAEQMVLGACLFEQQLITTAYVRPGDFYKSSHGKCFAAMQRMRERGEDVDVVTLHAELKAELMEPRGERTVAEALGGAAYLAHLLSVTPSSANFRSHERLVISAAQRRQMIRAMRLAQGRAENLKDADKVLSEAITELANIRRHEGDEVVTYGEIIVRGFEILERRSSLAGAISGITTGFRDLDRSLDGLQPAYYVVAARPGMGKTAFAMQVVRAAAKTGKKVGVVSIEMDEGQLSMRELSSESNVPLSRMNAGAVRGDDWDRLAQAAGTLHALPVWLSFAAFNDREIERVIDDMVQRLGADLIVVDYLQLASVENHEGNRETEVSKISRMFKRKVKEHRVAHVILAQLNRAAENRPDKRPLLADLRESGSIEQDADVIMFIYRDEVYHCKCPRSGECSCGRRGKAEILIRKGRMIRTGDVDLEWHTNTTSFRDAEEQGR